MAKRATAGFTLMELVVVVLIIGVLVAFGLPSYLQSVENTKADDAASLVQMMGTANRMYALDHGNGYAIGAFNMLQCLDGTACAGPNAANTIACDLVRCRYVADQDWKDKPYAFYVDTPYSGTTCSGLGAGIPNTVTACAIRQVWGASSCSSFSNSPTNCAQVGPYTAWGYYVTQNGQLVAIGGAPTPVQ